MKRTESPGDGNRRPFLTPGSALLCTVLFLCIAMIVAHVLFKKGGMNWIPLVLSSTLVLSGMTWLGVRADELLPGCLLTFNPSWSSLEKRPWRIATAVLCFLLAVVLFLIGQQ